MLKGDKLLDMEDIGYSEIILEVNKLFFKDI